MLCVTSRCEVNPVAMVLELRTILCLLKHSTHCLLECAASQRVRQRVLIQQQPNTPSSSRNTALCRKDENLIKPLPCMALLHYSIPRLSLGSLAPLWVLSLTQQSDNDVTKSQTSNASIRFIRAAFEFFFLKSRFYKWNGNAPEWARYYLTCLDNRAVGLWHGSAVDNGLEQEPSAATCDALNPPPNFFFM